MINFGFIYLKYPSLKKQMLECFKKVCQLWNSLEIKKENIVWQSTT